MGLLFLGVLFIFFGLLAMKLAPSYIEFFAIKKAVNAVGAEARGGASPSEVRKSFVAHQTIDDFTAVGPNDLEIGKDDSGTETVSVHYRKEIPLVANIGVYINFAAVSSGS
ncbi:MAG TPA: DUF4845 domain-containing protein [Burkholderiales bacterium]|nr:DUF4845 domain-containing protein [Burkholderiales bacterium]